MENIKKEYNSDGKLTARWEWDGEGKLTARRDYNSDDKLTEAKVDKGR